MSASEETFGATGTPGRETTGEVVLVSRLHAALERLAVKEPDANGAKADASVSCEFLGTGLHGCSFRSAPQFRASS